MAFNKNSTVNALDTQLMVHFAAGIVASIKI